MTWEELAHRSHMAMLILRGLVPEDADINAAPGSSQRMTAAVKIGIDQWLADYEAMSADSEVLEGDGQR